MNIIWGLLCRVPCSVVVAECKGKHGGQSPSSGGAESPGMQPSSITEQPVLRVSLQMVRPEQVSTPFSLFLALLPPVTYPSHNNSEKEKLLPSKLSQWKIKISLLTQTWLPKRSTKPMMSISLPITVATVTMAKIYIHTQSLSSLSSCNYCVQPVITVYMVHQLKI